MFSPEVVACGLQAAKNGSFGGKPVGDTRMMPGAFLVQRDSGEREATTIVWTHTYRHIADHPEFRDIGQQAGNGTASGDKVNSRRMRMAKASILAAAALSAALSMWLWFGGSKEQGLFVAIWVPSILSFGALMLSGSGRRE